MKIIPPNDTGETWPHDYAEYMRDMQSTEWPDDEKEMEDIEYTERDKAEDAKREAKLKAQRTKDAE